MLVSTAQVGDHVFLALQWLCIESGSLIIASTHILVYLWILRILISIVSPAEGGSRVYTWIRKRVIVYLNRLYFLVSTAQRVRNDASEKRWFHSTLFLLLNEVVWMILLTVLVRLKLALKYLVQYHTTFSCRNLITKIHTFLLLKLWRIIFSPVCNWHADVGGVRSVIGIMHTWNLRVDLIFFFDILINLVAFTERLTKMHVHILSLLLAIHAWDLFYDLSNIAFIF